MKKLYLLITFILLTFIVFLIVVYQKRSYKIEYTIADFKITENYLKKDGYLFNINYKDNNYPLFIKNNYSKSRKFIKEIKSYELDKEVCLNISVFDKNYYVCRDNNEIKTIYAMSKNFLEKYSINIEPDNLIKKYQNINIYNNDYTYLIWNYKGFYQIDKTEKSLISFKKDNYQNELAYQTEKYLIFPNYDSEYYFNKIYVYDIENEKLKEVISEFDISYDSYYLGVVKNSLYLIDKKGKIEYEINLKKNTIKIVSDGNYAKIYNGSKWEEVSITKAINNNVVFPTNNEYIYYLDDNHLYLKIKDYNILITNEKVKKIIHINNNVVYYLVADKLYRYEYLKDNKLLLKYPEWNFNYNNHIFIFN